MTVKLTVLVIVLLLGAYRILLAAVQYRSAKNPTPASVADVYDADTYLKWKAYNAETVRLEIVSAAVSTVVSLVLLATNLYAAFDSIFGGSIFWHLVSVTLLEALVDAVTGTVFAYVRVMVIEEKYGFNRSTVKTFVFDRIRGFIFELIFSLALVLLLALFHYNLGDYVVLLFAGALFLITLGAAFLYPIFSRLGNKFTPLEEGDLRERLESLLTKHGYKVRAIEVMDASRRTTKLNAYFTGFGKLKRIVLFDTLVEAMTPDEICAVFAHELGHGLHKDVLKRQILNFGNLLLMAVAVWLVVREPRLCTAFGFDGLNYGFAFLLVGVGLGVLQPLTGLVMNASSRRAEYRADRQAVSEGYGEAMVTALKKLARENFAHLSPARIDVVLEYSHPPLSDRIEAIEREGERGEG